MGTNSTEYSKAYRLKRKQADPNFLEKERAYGAKRYKTDAEYRAYMNKKNKAYYETEKGKQVRLDNYKRTSAKYPDRLRVRKKLQNAVRDRKIIKTDCQFTDGTSCSGRIEGHHYLGYEGENWKVVIWLCKSHHSKVHEALKASQKPV